MFRELATAFGFAERVPEGKFIVEVESGCDGSFVLHHFVSQYVKSNYKVLIVSTCQSFHHFYSIHLKLGTNLSALQDSKNLKFVDCLKLASDILSQEGTEGVDNNPMSTIFESKPSLRHLYNHIKSEFDSLTSLNDGNNPCLLLIDDVTVFLSLGVSLEEILIFVHYCRSGVMSSAAARGCVLVGAQKGNDIYENEENILWPLLTHQADLLIEIEALATGFSRDVHGQIKITATSAVNPVRETKLMQFKVEEKNVRVFAPGMCAAVL